MAAWFRTLVTCGMTAPEPYTLVSNMGLPLHDSTIFGQKVKRKFTVTELSNRRRLVIDRRLDSLRGSLGQSISQRHLRRRPSCLAV